jgi:hypothetical protein
MRNETGLSSCVMHDHMLQMFDDFSETKIAANSAFMALFEKEYVWKHCNYSVNLQEKTLKWKFDSKD